MPRMMISLTRDAAERLAQIAREERRDVRDQAAYLVERALDHGLLQEQSDDRQPLEATATV